MISMDYSCNIACCIYYREIQLHFALLVCIVVGYRIPSRLDWR